jgi:hypothetical protein
VVIYPTRSKSSERSWDKIYVHVLAGVDLTPVFSRLAKVRGNPATIGGWCSILGVAGMFEGLVGGHEDEALNWVHLLRFSGRDVEKAIIECPRVL